jgi:hypothetical protein
LHCPHPGLLDHRVSATLIELEEQLNSLQQEELEEQRIEMLVILARAIAPGRVAGALALLGITAADLASATGANKRTATTWLDEPFSDPKKMVHQVRLRELKEVVRHIVDDGTIPGQEADWLRYPNRSIDFSTPLDLVREGKWKQAGRLYCEDIGAETPRLFMDEEPLPHAVGVSKP